MENREELEKWATGETGGRKRGRNQDKQVKTRGKGKNEATWGKTRQFWQSGQEQGQ